MRVRRPLVEHRRQRLDRRRPATKLHLDGSREQPDVARAAPVRGLGLVQLTDVDEPRAELPLHVGDRAVQRRRAAHGVDRRAEITDALVRGAEPVPRADVVGAEGDRLLVGGDGVAKEPVRLVHHAELDPAIGVLRIVRDGVGGALDERDDAGVETVEVRSHHRTAWGSVEWRDGVVEAFGGFDAGAVVTLARGAGAPGGG